MSISLTVDEIMKIREEISRNKAENKRLNNRLKILEKEVYEYMSQKDQEGLRYKNKIITMETFQSTVSKKQKDKEKSMIEYLSSIGVKNPEEEYKKIQKIQKQEPVEKIKLKIK